MYSVLYSMLYCILRTIFSVPCTVYSLCTALCTLCPVLCILYTPGSVHSIYYMLHIPCIPYYILYMFYDLYSVLCALVCTLYSIQYTLCVLSVLLTFCTLLCTTHPRLYTVAFNVLLSHVASTLVTSIDDFWFGHKSQTIFIYIMFPVQRTCILLSYTRNYNLYWLHFSAVVWIDFLHGFHSFLMDAVLWCF